MKKSEMNKIPTCWVSVKDQLPQEDGNYEIANFPFFIVGLAYYDGLGFSYDGIYRKPDYWRKPAECLEKRYGKVTKK